MRTLVQLGQGLSVSHVYLKCHFHGLGSFLFIANLAGVLSGTCQQEKSLQ
jgi:hypothetical protein